MNINAPMQWERPDADNIPCKDCMFREADRLGGDIKGAALKSCDVFPKGTKPMEILFDGMLCPYYTSEK